MDNTLIVKNISKDSVANIDHRTPLISICDRFGARPPIPGSKAGRRVLYLEFDPGDHYEGATLITAEQVKDIKAFVDSLPSDTKFLYIHCGEGRIRSYTVAAALMCAYDHICHDGSGTLDRKTYHIVRGELEQLMAAK